MKKYIAILAAFFCIAYFSFAQDFINHLQKDEKGSGSVSVKQSEDISKLVNGGKKEQKQAGHTDRQSVSLYSPGIFSRSVQPVRQHAR